MGYNKIDDNTFPNMLAVLTGRKVSSFIWKMNESEVSGHFQKDPVNHYPFLRKNFSERGLRDRFSRRTSRYIYVFRE
jgi:hypothetical protein